MHESKGGVAEKGIGFTGLLQLAFIILKITGLIDWSWFWVLSPIWISILLFIAIALLVCIMFKR